MIKNVLIFLFTTFFLVIGQALWKISADNAFKQKDILSVISKLILNPQFLIGCGFYVLALGFWMYLLAQYEYSRIYPIFVGICIIISLITGYFLFHEHAQILNKIFGSVIILVGVFVVSR